MDTLKLLSRSTGLRPHTAHRSAPQLPSEGPKRTDIDEAEPASRKRKRATSDEKDEGQLERLSEDEIRKFQKGQKIKIVDLRKFRSEKAAESRKAQKEHSRVFPQPLTSFAQLGVRYQVSKALTANVAAQDYVEPTEVQMATLPLLLAQSAGEPDLLTIAPTGSGKTLAFLIPLIEKIQRHHRELGEGAVRQVSAVILAPTKELVAQTVNEGRKLTAKTGVTITAMRKGMRLHESQASPHLAEPSDDEDDSSKEGDEAEEEDEHRQSGASRVLVKSDIVVSTPSSLVHAISTHGDNESETRPLPNIQTLILDEADVLLDPLFRSDTLTVWSSCTSPLLRASFWSATIGSSIEDLAVSTISERQKALKIAHPPPLLRTIIGLKDTSLSTIFHKLIYTATESGKLLGIRQLLHPTRSTPPSSTVRGSSSIGTSAKPPSLPHVRPPFLIFTQTISRAHALHSELQYDIPASAGGSSRITVLTSSLSSSQRSTIMSNFRLGKVWILITTDLLSRGVDFRGVNAVINFDIPTTSASYVHRAGRTGRAGRQGGICITYYTKDDIKYVKAIANIIAASSSSSSQSPSMNTRTGSGKASLNGSGVERWLLDSLPDLTKRDRKELKLRGVQSRRAVSASDDDKARREKRKARIETRSGYERQMEDRRRGAVQASLRRKTGGDGQREGEGKEDSDWSGFD